MRQTNIWTDHLFVRTKKEYVRVPVNDIIYVEALKNYVQVVTAKHKFLIKTTIGHAEKALPVDKFCRIHRGYIVALQSVVGFNHKKVHIQGK